jgi:hypothetical protein
MFRALLVKEKKQQLRGFKRSWVNFSNILGLFLQISCAELFCTCILGLYFLEQEHWLKSCSKNVGEIDTLSY